MKRIFPLLLLAALLMAACGGKETPVPVTPVTITYLAFAGGPQADAEEAVLQQFTEANPAIQVERRNLNQAPQNYLLSPTPPDVMFMWKGYLFDSALRNQLLANLSDEWAEAGLLDAYDPLFQDAVRYEGSFYMVPGGYTWTGVYYNRAVFERYGLTPPQTWQEFLDICDTLLVNGETPLAIAGQDPFLGALWFDYLDLRLNGPQFHRDLLEGRIAYTEPEVETVFNMWWSLIEKGYVVDAPDRVDDMDSVAMLVRGDAQTPLTRQKAVMTLSNPLTVGQLPGPLRDELGFFRFPVVDPAQPTGELSIIFGYVIPSTAAHRAQAGALVRYLGTAEAQQTLVQKVGADLVWIPVHRGFDRSLLTPSVEAGESIVQSADQIFPPYVLAVPDQMAGAMAQAMRSLMRGEADAPPDLAQLQTVLENARQQAISAGEYVGE